MVASLLTILGAVLVGLSDHSSEDGSLLGVFISLSSSILYAVYSVVLVILIPEDESSCTDAENSPVHQEDSSYIPLSMLLGSFAPIAVLGISIISVFLSVFDIETFSFPSANCFGLIILCSIVAMSCDILWAKVTLLTNPVISNIGKYNE